MNMMTFGPVKHSDLQSSLLQIKNSVLEEIKLTVVYLPFGSDYANIISEIRNVIASPLVGCTTGGAGFTERGYTSDGIVGACIYGSDIDIQTVKITGLKNDIDGGVLHALKQIETQPRFGHSLFVLSDYKDIDGEYLMQSIKNNIPTLWKCFGGFAGDNWTFKGAKLFLNDSIFSDGAIFAYINSQGRSGIGVRHGFKAMENSPTFKVTDIQLNVLKELNGKPALDVYVSELQKQGVLKTGEDILKKLASFPIGVKTIFGEKLKIRTPLGIEGKSLLLAGSIPVGSEVKIVIGEQDALLDAAKELKELTLHDLGNESGEIQLVIDCAGRYQMLNKRYDEEVKNLRLDKTTPMLGFTSYGEFAKFGISITDFHNTTAVSCVW